MSKKITRHYFCDFQFSATLRHFSGEHYLRRRSCVEDSLHFVLVSVVALLFTISTATTEAYILSNPEHGSSDTQSRLFRSGSDQVNPRNLMRAGAAAREVSRMNTSILAALPKGDSSQYEYLSQRALTRPDWPTKHDLGTRSRNLLPYILEPHKHTDRVLLHSANSVLVQDKFPKAKVHLLVLPKWFPHRDLHPHDAFEDPNFLALVRNETEEGLKIAIPLLRREMEKSLKKSGMKAHQIQALLNNRDFSKDFQIGIHAHPSQHELHVHIISRDMVSWHRYDAGHYQAFNSPFLVPLASYPLPPDSQIREIEFQNRNLKSRDFRCWRCRKQFASNAYDALQDHLREEWQSWIREEPDLMYVNGIDSPS